MPEFIPAPNLHENLASQALRLNSDRTSNWEAVARGAAQMLQQAIAGPNLPNHFTPEQVEALKQGLPQNVTGIDGQHLTGGSQGPTQPKPLGQVFPRGIPQKEGLSLIEQKSKQAEAEALLKTKETGLNTRADQANESKKEIEALKAAAMKERDDQKAAHAKELADLRAQAAKSIEDFKAHHKESLASLNSALKTGDAAAIKAAADKYNAAVSGSLVKTGLSKLGILTPPKAAVPSSMNGVSVPAGKIMVEDKDGKRHFLPREQKDDAVSQGYKVVSE